MLLEAAGKDDCFVGRLRLDCAMENGLAFWISGDQLLKGAALNAVQIAERPTPRSSTASKASSRNIFLLNPGSGD